MHGEFPTHFCFFFPNGSETYHSLGGGPEAGKNLQRLHDRHGPRHHSK